jgi:hypothetical protein
VAYNCTSLQVIFLFTTSNMAVYKMRRCELLYINRLHEWREPPWGVCICLILATLTKDCPGLKPIYKQEGNYALQLHSVKSPVVRSREEISWSWVTTWYVRLLARVRVCLDKLIWAEANTALVWNILTRIVSCSHLTMFSVTQAM